MIPYYNCRCLIAQGNILKRELEFKCDNCKALVANVFTAN